MITVTAYHQRTKHHFQRYAKGPETLDWDDQPDPFRRFDGCSLITLPTPGRESAMVWADLLARNRQEAAPIDRDSIGLLLELSFGLSAWKQYGPDRWALRCNPSSGNLHPSEVYLINGIPDLLPQGVYHYVSYDQHLERRCTFSDSNSTIQGSLLIGLSSIHWREAWKYGERAYRYCQLDAGHAMAALSYAAAVLGWRIELLNDYTDAEVASLLGVDRHGEFVDNEHESPDWLCRICYNDRKVDGESERQAVLEAARQAVWQGKARSLGAYHLYYWPVIEEVSEAAQRHRQSVDEIAATELSIARIASDCKVKAAALIRQRRSAQHFNGKAEPIGQSFFFRLLSALSALDEPAFDGWPWPPAVHFCLFVHKVEGVSPGLYCLPRSRKGYELLKKTLSPSFSWLEQDGFSGLYLLHQGDVRQAAKTLSCHQAIASDSAFSLAMLAEFRDPVAEHPWNYRRLFWECGLLGQILYLEAEAAGLRGTGIGCFFDDEVHRVLEIKDDTLQSLYHFTVGEPLEDDRIQTLPAYAHLEKNR